MAVSAPPLLEQAALAMSAPLLRFVSLLKDATRFRRLLKRAALRLRRLAALHALVSFVARLVLLSMAPSARWHCLAVPDGNALETLRAVRTC